MIDILMVILLVVWVCLTYVLHRKKLAYFKFLVGSVGFFIFITYYLRNVFYESVVSVLMGVLEFIGTITGTFSTFVKASSVTVFHDNEVLSFLVTYECSGVIELLVYVSLLSFFPIYNSHDKAKFLFVGFFFIIGANIIRLSIIIYSAYFFGNETFFISHMVIGRLIYYGLIISLYFHVFTKPHVELSRKKVNHAK